jgi:hypothetical protein
MKTRFRTSKNNQKKSILKNRNFLNNQNYIINNKEKSKVIASYKSQENILIFYKILNFFIKNFTVNKIFIFFVLVYFFYLFKNFSVLYNEY